MKELLLKDKSGNWHYNNSNMDSCPSHVEAIEIPKGANYAYKEEGIEELTFFKDESDLTYNQREWFNGCDVRLDYVKECKAVQVWSRHTQQEELPTNHFEDVDAFIESNVEQDNVNHPSHYCGHPSGIECIEITRHHDFAIGNAIKYLWRAGLKDSDNEIQDLEKSVWYIQDKIKQLKKVNGNS